MSKALYAGIDSLARKVKKMYIGIEGVARKVKKAYIGVNGIARLFFAGGHLYMLGGHKTRRSLVLLACVLPSDRMASGQLCQRLYLSLLRYTMTPN